MVLMPFLPEYVPLMCFALLCTPHDVITTKTMPPSGRAYPQVYCVQNEVNRTNGSRDINVFVSYLSP